MPRKGRLEWSSSSSKTLYGLTLIELMVVLVILSILAVGSLPFAEMTVRRGKEAELRYALREIRSAIDRLHNDWKKQVVSHTSGDLSKDGYPITIDVLVNGVPKGDGSGERRRYLRSIPSDPFSNPSTPSTEQWLVRGYQDSPDAEYWDAEDVYDIRSKSEQNAINGSKYQDW